MRFAFLVNDFETLVATQTTAMLIAAAARKGHDVYVFGILDWSLSPEDEIQARVRKAEVSEGQSLSDFITQLKSSEAFVLPLATCDVLMLRTNPARDQLRQWAHSIAMTFARMAREHGVLVLNDPDGLMMAANKMYLSCIPTAFRPRTLISRDRKAIREFIHALEGACVLKPIQGTRGKDVFFLKPGEHTNFNQIIDVLVRDGFAMVQEFLPEAMQGDIRVVVMDGKILEHQGDVAAIARIPEKGDIRSNLHAGGTAAPPVITPEMRRAVEAIGPRLVHDGLFLVGLDFIGDKVIEINVFSTGGFRDAERFTERSFSDMVIDAVLQKCAEPRS